MRVHFASDHAGLELKNELFAFVRDELRLQVEDCGTFTNDPQDDYPAFIACAARAVLHDIASGVESCGIVLGASGTGEAIVANKFHGIRAALYYGGNENIIRLSREHNDTNVLSLSARFISPDEAKSAVRLWLSTPFSKEERHIRRIGQIETVAHEQ